MNKNNIIKKAKSIGESILFASILFTSLYFSIKYYPIITASAILTIHIINKAIKNDRLRSR